jgi:GNAT superfamily N-acetyltransferase
MDPDEAKPRPAAMTTVRLISAAAVRDLAGQLGEIAAAALGAPLEADVHAASTRWAAGCPGMRCAVAKQGREVTGFALSLPRPPPRLLAAFPIPAAELFGILDGAGVVPVGARLLAEIHVLPGHQGEGTGSRLLSTACPDNGRPVVLTVRVHSRARRFYRRRGFREAAVIPFPDGTLWAIEIAEAASLTPEVAQPGATSRVLPVRTPTPG